MMNHETDNNGRFSAPVSGVVFRKETNKLYVFQRNRILVCRGWPDPAAWEKTKEAPSWRSCSPRINISPRSASLPKECDFAIRHNRLARQEGDGDQLYFDFVLSPSLQRRVVSARAMSCFFYHLPREIRDAVSEFPEAHWLMLQMLARCPGSMDLVRTNPFLAFCIARNPVLHVPAVSKPWRTARQLVRMRQRDALSWLGFPGTGAMTHVCRKFSPGAVTTRTVRALRWVVRDPDLFKWLCHLKQLNGACIHLMANRDTRPHLSYGLLEDVGHKAGGQGSEIAFLVRDSLEMLRLAGRSDRVVFRTRAHVQAVHDALVDNLNRSQLAEILRFDFPTPPLEALHSSEAEIVPIRTPEELVREGKEQHNCVASYSRRIACGHTFVYSVLRPERATLSIVPGYGEGDWRLEDLRTSCNRDVRPETERLVREWIETATVRPIMCSSW